MTTTSHTSTLRTKRRVLAVAAVAAAAALLTACSPTSGSAPGSRSPISALPTAFAPAQQSSGTSTASGTTPSTPQPPASPTTPSPSPATSPSATGTPVHVKLLNADGSTYGVGMPVIALLSQRITSAKALQAATTATVDGRPIKVAWYVENSGYEAGYPIEAHLRPQTYWPAHAHVHVDIATKGLSAGAGMVFDDSLTSDWHTGAQHISVVNNRTHTITVTSDGKPYGTFPVSLGAAGTPTYSGTKVIMEQVPTVCMHDTDNTYHDCGIKWDQRVTYTGEYLHAAPWNCVGASGCIGPANNIGHGNSSNGCTNLRPADAEQLYHFLRVGDVVEYPNANGPLMPTGVGYGDWNVTWSAWLTGGIVPTS